MSRTQATGGSSGGAPSGSAGGDLAGTYPNPTLNIDGATGKTTPVNGDELLLADSAASFATKKLAWANLKATVITATNALYPSGSGTSTGTNTGDQTSVSGNAGTATALATARNIDGQAFDGSTNVTVIAPGTHAAASKATPVDADELSLVDSAASNVLKKLTWANLKATLKTYFDTIYQATGAAPTAHHTTHESGGSDALSLAASQIASGVLAQARLGSGSAGAGAKFLADDQTYKTIVAAATLAHSSNYLAADVTMTTAGTFYDGPALTPAAGTYLLFGVILLNGATSAARLFEAKLWDGTTIISSGQFEVTGSAAGAQNQIQTAGFVTTDGTKTYKISAKSTVNSDKILSGDSGGNKTVSYLLAVQIG